MKPPTIKPDDLVTIIEPAVVIRVGYPLTKQDALDAAEKEYNEKVAAFVNDICDTPDSFAQDSRLYFGVMEALASYWLRLKGYGGKQRSIHTEVDEKLRNTKGWRVLSKRVVKTGTYSNGGYSGNGDEPDYDPPHLSNEEVARLAHC